MRLLLHNTGGVRFMTDKRSRKIVKSEKLRRLFIEYKIYLACLTRINKDWSEVEQCYSIWNTMAPYKESHWVQVTNNTTKTKSGELHVRGTAIIGCDNIGCRNTHQDVDNGELGRWS